MTYNPPTTLVRLRKGLKRLQCKVLRTPKKTPRTCKNMTAFVIIYDSVTAFPCSLLFQNKNPNTLSSLPCRAVVSTHVSRYLRKLSMKNWDEGERKYSTFPAQKPTKQEKVTTSQIYMYVFIHLCASYTWFCPQLCKYIQSVRPSTPLPHRDHVKLQTRRICVSCHRFQTQNSLLLYTSTKKYILYIFFSI